MVVVVVVIVVVVTVVVTDVVTVLDVDAGSSIGEGFRKSDCASLVSSHEALKSPKKVGKLLETLNLHNSALIRPLEELLV